MADSSDSSSDSESSSSRMNSLTKEEHKKRKEKNLREKEEREKKRMKTKKNDSSSESSSDSSDSSSEEDSQKKKTPLKSSPSSSSSSSSEDEDEEEKKKEKPNFNVSGKLAAATNTVNGVVLKFSEPNDACKPTKRWKLFRFKGTESLDPVPVYRQSAYLFGRERLVADIPLDHPSCSAQHALLQFRKVNVQSPNGVIKVVRPYIMDLESTNGTLVNKKRVESSRFIELKECDVLNFGFSTRDYVLLHENSAQNFSSDK
eukprot:TRINITY_DN105_c0_g1_i7.p3 TRINITY_DN105_c0_g1~~TRINITY_DN105_c0_g1_i7.p3  ORF type:complete len:259 (-),score=79.35 TRINITY_DN105_c0_g1_i7:3998-4774(-)